jgi:transposase
MMKNGKRVENGAPAESEGARRATGDSAGGARRRMVEENDAHNRSRIDDRGPGATSGTPLATVAGPLAPGQRWSAARKRDVTLRLLRGESVEVLSRELGVEMYRLEEWKSRALSGIEASLRERETTAGQVELDAALKRLGELSMENELLKHRLGVVKIPLAPRRSRR